MLATNDPRQLNLAKKLAIVFFFTTWILLCIYSVGVFTKNFVGFTFGPIDVARRVTAPESSLTAILVRSYASIDLNFALYVSDDPMADVTDITETASFITAEELANMQNKAVWIKRALWISPDYEPTTDRHWHEDIVWSQDGAIIAVTVEEQYVFAYDFDTRQRYEVANQIQELLTLHSQ